MDFMKSVKDIFFEFSPRKKLPVTGVLGRYE